MNRVGGFVTALVVVLGTAAVPAPAVAASADHRVPVHGRQNPGLGASGLGCVPPGSGWAACHPGWTGNDNCYSPMGMSPGMSLSTAERVQTGIVEPGELASLDGGHGPVDQVVTLQPRGGGTGVRGAAVLDPETGETYFLDYRVTGGLDHPWAAVPGCADGLVVTVPSASGGTMVLPPVPAQPIGSSRASWQAGETIPLSGAVQLDVLSLDPLLGAQVRVRIVPGPAFDRVAELSFEGEMAQTAAVTIRATGFSPTPERLSYRWYADGQLITGANGAPDSREFIIIPDGVRALTVEVAAYHAGRSYAVARGTWPVAKNLVHASRHARLKGRFAVGGRVTTFFRHKPDGPGRLKLRYAWFADGRLIARTSHKSLRLPRSVASKRLKVVVTITGREVQKAVRSSRPSRPVARR